MSAPPCSARTATRILSEGTQQGVSALASGERMTIKPEGFDDTHRRGRTGETVKRGKRNYQDEYS